MPPQTVIFIPAGPARSFACKPAGFFSAGLRGNWVLLKNKSHSPQNFGAETAAGRVKPGFLGREVWGLGIGALPAAVISHLRLEMK